MKRFFNEDAMPDEFFSNEDGDGPAGGDVPQDDIERAIALDDKDLNQKILFKTIRMLESSEPKWDQKTLNAKLKLILKTYSYFLMIVEA